MKNRAIYIIICILVLSLSLFQCSDSGGMATVRIDLGFLQDRGVRSTTTPPPGISSTTITVTGSDMDTIEVAFPASVPVIVITVPAGNGREFSLKSIVDPVDPSTVLSYTGKVSADLAAGETVTLIISMNISETKIVIPDYAQMFPAHRIIQINDISGDGWIEKQGGDFNPAIANFFPYDVDFDNTGRIYIANYTSIGGNPKILRIDNMMNPDYFTLVNDAGAGGVNIVAIAVDNMNNLIYYATSGELYRTILDGSGLEEVLTITVGVDSIGTITGIDIDENGLLYIAGKNVGGADRIFQYDPISMNVTKICDNTGVLSIPWDVLVKGPDIYVANRDGADGYKILLLDPELQFVQGFGNQVPGPAADTNPGMFYGPHRFVARLNEKITIIDDHTGGFNIDKLVSMDNINGLNWTTFGESGFAPGQFSFFNGS